MSESRLLRSRSRKGSFKESSVNNQQVINFVVRKHDTKLVKETGVIMNTSPSKRSIRDENSGSCENNISSCKRPRMLSERLEIRLPLSPHKDTWNSSELLTPCATKTLVSSFADVHGPPFRPSSNKKEQILSCSNSAAQVGESLPSSSTRRNLASDFSKSNSKGNLTVRVINSERDSSAA